LDLKEKAMSRGFALMFALVVFWHSAFVAAGAETQLCAPAFI
jgi:hypothetical protein